MEEKLLGNSNVEKSWMSNGIFKKLEINDKI